VSKECQYKCIAGLALDLVAAPASQAYVERMFSAASGGMKTQQNKGKSGKESFPETQLHNAG